jgi:hypothetical protein
MLKRIDFDKSTIPANGKEYRVEKELSIARFKELESMQVELYYGFDMEGMFKKMKEAFNDLNKSKVADASVKLYRLMEGVADKVDKREPVALRICTLFLNTEGEDAKTWSEELANEKIKDWQAEGYSVNDFFSLATVLVPGFLADYQSIMDGTFLSEEETSEQPESDPLPDTKKT